MGTKPCKLPMHESGYYLTEAGDPGKNLNHPMFMCKLSLHTSGTSCAHLTTKNENVQHSPSFPHPPFSSRYKYKRRSHYHPFRLPRSRVGYNRVFNIVYNQEAMSASVTVKPELDKRMCVVHSAVVYG